MKGGSDERMGSCKKLRSGYLNLAVQCHIKQNLIELAFEIELSSNAKCRS